MGDVAIIGGGLAGLSLALQLKQECPELSVTVYEKNSHPAPEAAFKVGESTVELAAHYFAEVLGLKEHLQTCQLPKLGLRYFFPYQDNTQIEKRLELGGNEFWPTPSFQLDRGRFENFLGERCREVGVNFVDGTLIRNPDKIEAHWLVDASGRSGLLKRKFGLKKDCGHKASSAWFRINTELNIDDWSKDPNWRKNNSGRTSRWYSTNHLMGRGYWVWVIPLASGSTSIGIVTDQSIHPVSDYNSYDKALSWLETHEPQCAEQIRSADAEVQDFLAYKNYAYSCKQVFSEDGWFLTGEAGLFIDPFYSPGSDFIAMSNTFITDLITREHKGEDVKQRTAIYNQLYLTFAENTFKIFENQYQIFGNPKVMPEKIRWDFALYWTQFAFLFIQGKLCDLSFFLKIRPQLEQIKTLSLQMQERFREEHLNGPPKESSGMIDLAIDAELYDLNLGLKTPLSDEECLEKFRSNVAALERWSQTPDHKICLTS